MMNKYVLLILCFFNLSIASRSDWSSTPIDKFIDHNFNQMIFREPLYLVPYDIKIGLFTYGGAGYFSNIIKGDFSLDSNPIILDNQDINNDFLSSSSERNGFFIELDIFKYNLLEKFYHQNLSDIHIGTGLRYSSVLSNPLAPIYFDESDIRSNQGYRFRPMFIDIFANISSVIQYSPKFYLYGYYSFGLSYASIYESLAQNRYMDGTGFNENISLGYKYIIDQSALPYNYIVGLELRFGRTYINKIYDSEDVSPIIGIDMYNSGLFMTFGTLFGGKSTRADKAYSMMLEGDYIGASMRFKQFLNVYNYEFRYDEAKKMLNFCYSQIPYQYFDRAILSFNNQDYDDALINFNKAEQTAKSDLILEIESYKRDIAQHIINKTDLNLDKVLFSKSIYNLNRARSISPYLWAETDKIEAKILLKRGDILNDFNSYMYAVEYYKEALALDPSLFTEINNRYNDLVIKIINDVNDTNRAHELKLVREYLKLMIDLKPQYSESVNKFISQIDEKLKNYDAAIIKMNLNKYVENRKAKRIEKINKQVSIGMDIHQVELILGAPESVLQEDDYQLWVYKNNKSWITYFFKDYLLFKIE